ncbi:PAS domain S-box protein [Candidatus Woesearchaeota archaeon]|jgi:PAS domain S-box-containing protein|nr:PAS domain S-box protein [Candidatus Woesearchaeota archaeon]MBT6519131.1 PAS domain S-box protein [Candidatus Woesearchaeota archaeon]MBT7367764.1 PAS domain S-box protein [Candidatus Woesearchaeota archaeon]
MDESNNNSKKLDTQKLKQKISELEKKVALLEQDKSKVRIELKFKNALLQAQSNTSLEGMLVVDEKGKTLLYNHRFTEMWSIPQNILKTKNDDQMVSYVLDQLSTPEDFVSKIQYLNSHPEEKSHDEIEFKDGKIFHRYSTPLKIHDENYLGRVWYFRDVTDLKKTQKKLKESVESFETIVQSNLDGIVILSEDDTVLFANKEATTIFKSPVNEFIGGKINLDKKSARVEYPIKYDGEKTNDYEVTINKTNWKGIPAHLITFRNITLRKETERELITSEEKFRSLFENSKQAVYISSREGKIKDLNSAGLELFGYLPEEVKKIHAKDLYEQPNDRKKIIKLMEEKEFIQDHEVMMKKKNGELIDVLLTSNVKRDESGKVIQYQGIIHDISERKKMEEKIIQAQKMDSIGNLAGGIAHDFNNMLTGIIGYAELLKNLETDEKKHRFLDNLIGSANRSSELTKKLLGFGRRGKNIVKPVNINEIINEVYSILEYTVDKKIELKTYLDELINDIDGDPSQINQVIMNLCVNAAESMSEGGKLEIRTSNFYMDEKFCKKYPKCNQGNYVLLEVKDSGCGMDNNTLKKIFEPFFTTKKAGDIIGTGLGLATTYGIIQNHKGIIDVSSKKGKGSVFKIYLPAGHVKIKELEKTDIESVEKNQGLILIIEDESFVNEYITEVLEHKGYSTLKALDGTQGVDLYEQNHNNIDGVILDMKLPGLNGKEVYIKIKEINPYVKVLLTSGYSKDGHAQEILNLGVKDFIQKPFGPKLLLEKIYDLLTTKG